MAPPRSPGGQLDQISQAIGQLEGRFDGVEAYIHDKRHDDKNLSQKIDAISQQITREVTRMKAEIQVQLDAIDRRVGVLEQGDARLSGAKQLGIWIAQTFLAALAAVGAMLATGKHP